MPGAVRVMTDEEFRGWLDKMSAEVRADTSGAFLWEPDLKRFFEAIWADGYNRGRAEHERAPAVAGLDPPAAAAP